MPSARNPPLTEEERRAQNRARQAKWMAKPGNQELLNARKREAYARKHPMPAVVEPQLQEPIAEPVAPVAVAVSPIAEPVAPVVNNLETLQARLSEVGGEQYRTLIKTLSMFLDISRGIEKILKPGISKHLKVITNQNGNEMSTNTRKHLVQAILWTVTHLEIPVSQAVLEELRALFDELKLVSTDEHDARVKVPVPWWEDYLLMVLDKYGANSKENIVARMYFEHPLRDDFKGLVVLSEPSDTIPNYILVPPVGRARLIIREYKTVKKFDPVNDLMSPGLTASIRKYIEQDGLKKDGTLFGKTTLSPFIGKMTQELGFGPKHGVNYFRYMSAPPLGEGAISAEERVRIARLMKHSTETQKKYMRYRLPSVFGERLLNKIKKRK